MAQAMVKHGGLVRKGRGFSCKEIEDAGLSCQQFCALDLPWDSRRRSSHKENVDALKKLPAAKPKPAKKTEAKK